MSIDNSSIREVLTKIQNLIPFNILTTGMASFVLNCLLIFAIVMIEKQPIQVIELKKLVQENSLNNTNSDSTQLKKLSKDIKTKIQLQYKGEHFTKYQSTILNILTNYKNWFLILPMLNIVVHFFKILKNNQLHETQLQNYEKEDMKLILEHVEKIKNAVMYDDDAHFKSKSETYIQNICDSLKLKNGKKKAIENVTLLHDLLYDREMKLLTAARQQQQLIARNKNEKTMRHTMTHFIHQALIYANLCGKEDNAYGIILQIIGSLPIHSPQSISTSPIVDVKETEENDISHSPTSQQMSPNDTILLSYLNFEETEPTLSNMNERIQYIDFQTTGKLDHFVYNEVTPINSEIFNAMQKLQSLLSQPKDTKKNDSEFKHYYDTINFMHEKIVKMLDTKELITSATRQVSQFLSKIYNLDSDEHNNDSLDCDGLMKTQLDLKQNYDYFQTLENEVFLKELEVIFADMNTVKHFCDLLLTAN
jgi:hypothetical protein